MQLTHLSLTNFRSFTRLDIEIPRRIILLTGKNAQGKTSFLEAIFFLATFTSFQTHSDRQLMNFLEARKDLGVARLVGEYVRGPVSHKLEARLILEPTGVNGKRLRKEILLDGVKRPAAELIGHFNAVVFFPQMAKIIEEGPDNRRRYFNLALAQTIPGYAGLLGEYHQALTERNALLKLLGERGGDRSQLDFWDASLARIGASIIHMRINAIHELGQLAGAIHKELTRGNETLRIHYQPAYDPLASQDGQLSMPLATTVQRNGINEAEVQAGFLAALGKSRQEDIRRGLTILGPHRDEMRFLADGIDLTDFGSRGQIRTALLALKLAEIEWMKARTGQCPVLLLDEVMVELDDDRRKDLLSFLGSSEQALLTTTDTKLYSPEFMYKAETWNVNNGMISQDLDDKS